MIKRYILENGQNFTCDRQLVSIKIKILKSFLGSNVLLSLNEYSFLQPATFNHRLHLLRAIIEKYVNVKLFHIHKTNPGIKAATKGQKRNKLNLFEGNKKKIKKKELSGLSKYHHTFTANGNNHQQVLHNTVLTIIWTIF